MSWSLFQAKCSVLTGKQHVSRRQFARTLSNAYHQSVVRHIDIVTAGGRIVGRNPQTLFQGILSICEKNLRSPERNINFLQQIEPFIYAYWAGTVITGPTGVVIVTSTGKWIAPYVKQNYNFNVLINAMSNVARIHIMTLLGTYTSTVVTGLTTPWSGYSLQTIP